MSKGESDWLSLPSSTKGEIVGIMIHMLYLMATHSSQMINYSAAKLFSGSRTFMQRKVHAISCRETFTHFHVEKISFHVEKSSRIFMKRKVHALSCKEKLTHFHEEQSSFHAEKFHALSCREKCTHMGNLMVGSWY